MIRKEICYGIILVIQFFIFQNTMCMSGWGNFDIKTKDIWLENIKGIDVQVNSCSNDIVSSCGAAASCNITIGPCFVRTSSQLNAAPNKISFSRYLAESNPYVINVNRPDIITPLVRLLATNSYTTIIQTSFTPDRVRYMIIALPTNINKINAMQKLPLALTNYLKDQEGTFIKIYRTIGTTQTWTEVAEIHISVDLTDTILDHSNIVEMEIIKNGDLALTIKDLKKKNKKQTISTTRIVYTRFK